MEEELEKLSPEAHNLFKMHSAISNADVKQEVLNPQDKLMKDFEDERDKWGAQMNIMAKSFDKIRDIINLQMDLYHNRHVAHDRKITLLSEWNRFNKKYKVNLGDRLKYYNKDFDRKLTTGEKDKLAEADVSGLKFLMDCIQNQIDYFEGVVKHIDNMIFGLKYRMEMEEYMRGMKKG